MICILPDDEFLEDSGCSEVIVDTLYMWKEKKTGKGGEDGEERESWRGKREEIIMGTTKKGALPGLSRSNSQCS